MCAIPHSLWGLTLGQVSDTMSVLGQVYDRMQAKGLEPTATTFTALVSAHCKSDNLQAALEVGVPL